MSRISNEEKLKRIHTTALAQFDRIQAAMKEERKQCLEDRRFYSIAGAQWEGSLKDQFANRMRFEMNKVHLAVIRIINEYRNNRISVKFVPRSKRGSSELADVCAGLFRADYEDSTGEEATDNGFEEAVGGGIGAIRLCNEYEYPDDEDDERQRIRFKPIFDADSCVFFDLDAKRQDKADAKHCFVLSALAPETYKDEYGDNPATWPKEVHMHEFDWSTPDVVYIAEYYLVEQVTKTIVVFVGLDGSEEKIGADELEEDPEHEQRLLAIGYKEKERKTRRKQRVHKYILSGSRILDDVGNIAGPNIPIIPIYGKRWIVDNVERCMGHVRLSKDAQRLKNVEISKTAEIAAASGYEKPIFTPEQIAGHQTMWEEEPVKNYPYMLVNPITDANGQSVATGPIGYTKPPSIPPAMAALLQLTDTDLKEILGNAQQTEMASNIAYKTAELIQQRVDMQTYIYISNMAKAQKRAGEVWLGMAMEVYVEEDREMKIVDQSGEADFIELQRPAVDEKTNRTIYENDLANAKFDVSFDVGPSSSSRRQATVRSLKEMLGSVTDPETMNVLSSMIMMNMEGEGVQDVRDFFRQRLIRMGAIKPTKEEADILAGELKDKPPSPMDQYALAEADKSKALAVKARADTLLTVANVDKARAQVVEILAGIDAQERDQVLAAATLAAQTMGQVTPPAPAVSLPSVEPAQPTPGQQA